MIRDVSSSTDADAEVPGTLVNHLPFSVSHAFDISASGVSDEDAPMEFTSAFQVYLTCADVTP